MNVIGNLFLHTVREPISDRETFVLSNHTGVANELTEWLYQFYTIELVSDVCHYDMVLLIDLLAYGSTAFDLPSKIPAVCHDINQDIARHYQITDEQAFDMSREQIVSEVCGQSMLKHLTAISGRKHNSLYDAEVIKAIYDEISM